MIKVLIVEDSPTARELLIYLLSADSTIRVVGTAHNGREAVEAASSLQPDVITMDIHMPTMNGFDATRRIMETTPIPIVIVTASLDTRDVATTFKAVESGALAVVARPPGFDHPDHETLAQQLVQTVKLMSEVKVVRRWRRAPAVPAPVGEPILAPAHVERPREHKRSRIKLVAIGASTGGPLVLQTILNTLPGDFPAPIVIVQHMAAGFIAGFAEWLAHSSKLPVRVALHGEVAAAGRVYIAPDGAHLTVERDGKIELRDDLPEHGMRPSVSYLFRAVAETYKANAAGVLLTGMGRDGALELKSMRDQGAVTLVQDKESSVVHGMPGEAIRLDAAAYVLSPEGIAAMLIDLVNV